MRWVKRDFHVFPEDQAADSVSMPEKNRKGIIENSFQRIRPDLRASGKRPDVLVVSAAIEDRNHIIDSEYVKLLSERSERGQG